MEQGSGVPYGYCQCGCGQKTNLSLKTNSSRGLKRGEPYPCIKGHVRKGVPHNFRQRESHYLWKGDAATDHTKRRRVQNWYSREGKCRICGNDAQDRHHIDGNLNNDQPQNIIALCRRCHMASDGRLKAFRDAQGGRGKCSRDVAGRFVTLD